MSFVSSGTCSSTSRATIYDTVITDFSIAGIQTNGTAEVNVDRGALSGNAIGVQARAGTTVRLYDVMTSQNGTGVKGAGAILSFGNNAIGAGNGTNGAPTGTTPQQ